MNFILAQIFGLIALIIMCISYFVKNKSKFLILQIIGNVFYAVAFLVVNAYVGGIITLISIFRLIYIFLSERFNFKFKLHFLFLFVSLYLIVSIIFWQNWYDFIPIITSITFTFAFAIKDLQKMRLVLIFPNILLILYCILSTTYVSAVLDFIEVVVLIVAYLNFRKNN